MLTRIIIIVIIFFSFNTALKSQELSLKTLLKNKKYNYNLSEDKILEDTSINVKGKSTVQKVNIGGLFISPALGTSFPLATFGNYSNPGLIFGVKFELAYSRLYPFIFGFVYEVQKNKGNADFTTVNSLTKFDTKITSLGGSMDIILNKFIKSDFTIPVLTFEIKYANVDREVTPAGARSDIPTKVSLLSYSAGLTFTIYVIDLSSKYTYAKDFNSLSFQARFHLPVIKF